MTDHVSKYAQKKVKPYIGGDSVAGIASDTASANDNKKAAQNMYDLLIVNM